MAQSLTCLTAMIYSFKRIPATASYRLHPLVILNKSKPVPRHLAAKFQSCFSPGVITINEDGDVGYHSKPCLPETLTLPLPQRLLLLTAIPSFLTARWSRKKTTRSNRLDLCYPCRSGPLAFKFLTSGCRHCLHTSAWLSNACGLRLLYLVLVNLDCNPCYWFRLNILFLINSVSCCRYCNRIINIF